jgi:hypothetical protein
MSGFRLWAHPRIWAPMNSELSQQVDLREPGEQSARVVLQEMEARQNKVVPRERAARREPAAGSAPVARRLPELAERRETSVAPWLLVERWEAAGWRQRPEARLELVEPAES